jgi:hypothetical protein
MINVTRQGGLCVLATFLACASTRADTMLADFHNPSDDSFIITQSTGANRIADGMVLQTGETGEWAALKLRPAQGAWDASNATRIVFDIENRSPADAKIRVRALNPLGTDWADSATTEGFVSAGKRVSFNLYLYRKESDLAAFPALAAFKGMRGLPGGFQSHWRTINAADIRAIDFEVIHTGPPQQLVLHSIRATHPPVPDLLREKGRAFFPFVDKYGQYRWEAWPEKVKSDAELLAAHLAEVEDLRLHEPLENRDKFGGLRDGPNLGASRFFRTEKIEGKWWLVDPDGNLFWSHGANSVGTDSASTLVTGREKYFADLPPREGAFFDAWKRTAGGELLFDHLKANLIRQFGPTYAQTMVGLDNDRMQSWGLNTIGAWSDDRVIAQRRVPYTAIIHPTWPAIRHGMPDVYAPDFEKRVIDSVAKGVGTAAGDAWCIGFFIDNELHWEMQPLAYIANLLECRPDAYTRRQFVAQLRALDGDIASLNAKLGTRFASWKALDGQVQSLKPEQLEKDDAVRTLCLSFYADVATRYFKASAAAIRDAAPGQLYLGCRMHLQNKLLVEVAAKYCDVLSFNRYDHSVADFDALGADLPVIVSEFHFGALDAGMLGTGLRPASDRFDRAMKYVDYVEGALRNPRIVGTHWFAYCPQSITGREDGENFNTGLFDICNQPYPEMRDALRKVAGEMYELRMR